MKNKRSSRPKDIGDGDPAPKRMKRKDFENELSKLQVELVRLQTWVNETGARLVAEFGMPQDTAMGEQGREHALAGDGRNPRAIETELERRAPDFGDANELTGRRHFGSRCHQTLSPLRITTWSFPAKEVFLSL